MESGTNREAAGKMISSEGAIDAQQSYFGDKNVNTMFNNMMPKKFMPEAAEESTITPESKKAAMNLSP